MARRVVRESILMQATAETIWRIITDDEYNTHWLAAFGERNIAETDWQEGSKAVFLDSSRTGLIAIISKSRPFEEILIENVGLINKGVEDRGSREAIESRAFFERYLFTPEGNATRMSIEVLVEDDLYEDVSASWIKALEMIKKQAESH